jgi:hypothetical protein
MSRSAEANRVLELPERSLEVLGLLTTSTGALGELAGLVRGRGGGRGSAGYGCAGRGGLHGLGTAGRRARGRARVGGGRDVAAAEAVERLERREGGDEGWLGSGGRLCAGGVAGGRGGGGARDGGGARRGGCARGGRCARGRLGRIGGGSSHVEHRRRGGDG